MHIFLFRVITAFSFVFLSSMALADPLGDCHEYAANGVPATSGTLICRMGYLLAHDSDHKTPFWVAEHLTYEKASVIKDRKGTFKADPLLPRGQRAEPADYQNSGYDQGHMAASANMAWSDQAMKESFFLSNAVPQQGVGMNQGIWKDLEKKVRGWAIDRGELYIYTGPAYISSPQRLRTIGRNRVGVPTHVYKIVYDPNRFEAIAFLMPNIRLKSSDMPHFIVSIRTIEKETGLDFLSDLDQTRQEAIENNKPDGLWN